MLGPGDAVLLRTSNSGGHQNLPAGLTLWCWGRHAVLESKLGSCTYNAYYMCLDPKLSPGPKLNILDLYILTILSVKRCYLFICLFYIYIYLFFGGKGVVFFFPCVHCYIPSFQNWQVLQAQYIFIRWWNEFQEIILIALKQLCSWIKVKTNLCLGNYI